MFLLQGAATRVKGPSWVRARLDVVSIPLPLPESQGGLALPLSEWEARLQLPRKAGRALGRTEGLMELPTQEHGSTQLSAEPGEETASRRHKSLLPCPLPAVPQSPTGQAKAPAGPSPGPAVHLLPSQPSTPAPTFQRLLPQCGWLRVVRAEVGRVGRTHGLALLGTGAGVGAAVHLELVDIRQGALVAVLICRNST